MIICSLRNILGEKSKLGNDFKRSYKFRNHEIGYSTKIISLKMKSINN